MNELELGAENINRLFPRIPMTVFNQGWIYGMWYCGTRFKGRKFYGEYPGNFLTRALAIFPNAKSILHCPSGTVTGPGITVDIKREGYVQPQIMADAKALPFPDDVFDLILSDPPYSGADSKKYGCEKFPMGKFVNEAWRVLKHGGHLGVLHIWYPAFRRHKWKMVGAIGVMTGFQRQVRIFSIFEKINGNQLNLPKLAKWESQKAGVVQEFPGLKISEED